MSYFISSDPIWRTRKKLRALKKDLWVPLISVDRYLSECRNTFLMITDRNEEENMDFFVNGPRYNIRAEDLETISNSFEERARLALNVDSAVWRSWTESLGFNTIVITEVNRLLWRLQRDRNSGPATTAQHEQRKKESQMVACFKRHKVERRPWNCSRLKTNNAGIDRGNSIGKDNTVYSSDLEN